MTYGRKTSSGFVGADIRFMGLHRFAALAYIYYSDAMLRDDYIALEAFAKYKRNRQKEVESVPISGNGVDMNSIPVTKDRLGPSESIKPRDFEPIGSRLYPYWHNEGHAKRNIRVAQREIKRWERSIAFLDSEEIPIDSETVCPCYLVPQPSAKHELINDRSDCNHKRATNRIWSP